MFKLLNRLSHLVSFIMGFILSLVFISANSYNLRIDDIIGALFLGVIVGLIFKKIFLSKEFIESRLEFFANSLSKIEQKLENKNILNQKVEKIEEKQLEREKLENEKIEEIYEKIPKIEKIEKSEEKVEEPSKMELAIKNFFAENLLAKLGGILVFLGVLFLLSLVYSSIGPVGKLIIGFAIGFGVYFAGVILDKKELHNEGRILLGIGLLINYLVILGGRYLIGDTVDNNLLSIGTTFAFLIFNTVFAVVTSLVYKSRTLLLFSFIFAFVNPLLIGGSSDNPYTLVGYSLIVAFGGLFLSLKQKDILLAVGVFLLSNILFLIAPFNSDIHWIVKLASSAIISISSIYVVYKVEASQLSKIFLGSYLFLVLLLGTGENYLKETTSFISYMFTIVLYFAVGIYYFLRTSFNSLIFLLVSPILIVLGLSFTGVLFSITTVLALIVLVYLIGFTFVKDKLPDFLKYLFFIILGFYIFLTNSFLSIQSIHLELVNFITVIIVSFVFIFTSYYLSTKKNLEFLYSIGTIGAILTLAPVIITKSKIIEGNFDKVIINTESIFYISILAVVIFALSNWLLPFINKNLINNEEGSSSIKNLLIGVISGLLFIGYELFNYGTEFFPGVTLGGAFTILAIVYFVLAYSMLNKIGIENIKKQELSKNVIYTYLGVSISVFSLAIALLFSKYDVVISAVWLFEATLMFYFYHKIKESKIFSAGIILFMIGVFKLFALLDVVKSKDFIFLIPFTLIFISYVLNVKYLDNIKSGLSRVSHDILHILGIATLGFLLLEIIPSTGHGWSTLGIAIFLFAVSFVYSYFSSNILKIFFTTIFTAYLIMQVSELDMIFWNIDNEKIGYLRILQYISTVIMGVIVLFWNKINKPKSYNIFINFVFSLYLLVITSYYVYDIFDTTFAVTIYWGVTASILLFYGIAKDLIKLRTIGLYIITLTAFKIFFYDIWYGIDDAVSRVVAFIVIGILLIIISTRYTRKYGNNIVGEFSLSNLIDNESFDLEEKEEQNDDLNQEKISNNLDEEKVFLINEKIKNMDVSNLRGVKFFVNGGDNVEIRAENLIKIVKMITNDFQDIEFKKGELKDTYDFVATNYKSELSKAIYDKIVNVLQQFVEKGGRVEGIFKK